MASLRRRALPKQKQRFTGARDFTRRIDAWHRDALRVGAAELNAAAATRTAGATAVAAGGDGGVELAAAAATTRATAEALGRGWWTSDL